MKISPEISLAGLLLLGIAVSGWIYGIHWKQIGKGGKFTDEETLIIRLQDQIDLLTEENDSLSRQLRELKQNSVSSSEQQEIQSPQ